MITGILVKFVIENCEDKLLFILKFFRIETSVPFQGASLRIVLEYNSVWIWFSSKNKL